MLDMLELINAKLIEENDSVLIVVYAVNQKGRSQPVFVRDLELGAVVKLDRGMYDATCVDTKIITANHKLKILFLSFCHRLDVDNLTVANAQDSTPYFIGIVSTILIAFMFIAFKIMSICWSSSSTSRDVSSSKRAVAITTTPATTTMTIPHNDHQLNGATKLTNHSNNLLIISSYNGSISKVGHSHTQLEVPSTRLNDDDN